MDGLVPSFGCADGPWAAGIVGAGGGGVVAPLPVAAADWVNRRQVEHVEAHGRDVGQARLRVLKRAVLARRSGGRAREELVPGAEARAGPVYPDGQDLVVGRGEAALGVALHKGGELRGQRAAAARRLALAQGGRVRR